MDQNFHFRLLANTDWVSQKKQRWQLHQILWCKLGFVWVAVFALWMIQNHLEWPMRNHQKVPKKTVSSESMNESWPMDSESAVASLSLHRKIHGMLWLCRSRRMSKQHSPLSTAACRSSVVAQVLECYPWGQWASKAKHSQRQAHFQSVQMHDLYHLRSRLTLAANSEHGTTLWNSNTQCQTMSMKEALSLPRLLKKAASRVLTTHHVLRCKCSQSFCLQDQI